MKSLLLVANFKSHKTVSEAKTWSQEFEKNFKPAPGKEVVVCPSFTALAAFSDTSFKLGAQDISPFDEGAFTGEINGIQLKEFAEYVLIGHSERRENFKEEDEVLRAKVSQAVKEGLKVIFFVQNALQIVPEGVEVIVYEPTFAIGTGVAEMPENATDIAEKIKDKNPNVKILYGGSVTPQNIKEFTELTLIDGVVVGGASLDAKEFAKLIELA